MLSLLLILLLFARAVYAELQSKKQKEKSNETKIVEVINKQLEKPELLPEFPKGEYKIVRPGGVEQYRPLVAKYFPAREVDNALVIMAHESKGNPNAISKTNDYGLMQIHAPLWTNFFSVTTEQLKDPETNIKLASIIWRRGGWKAWSTWKYLYSG